MVSKIFAVKTMIQSLWTSYHMIHMVWFIPLHAASYGRTFSWRPINVECNQCQDVSYLFQPIFDKLINQGFCKSTNRIAHIHNIHTTRPILHESENFRRSSHRNLLWYLLHPYHIDDFHCRFPTWKKDMFCSVINRRLHLLKMIMNDL